MSSNSTCLVARAMPCVVPSAADNSIADALVSDMKKLSLQKAATATAPPAPHAAEKKATRTIDAITPADYVTLQSLRSSALAHKTNTTSKFSRHGANLFADLLNDEAATGEKKETKAPKSEVQKKSEDNKESENKPEEKSETDDNTEKQEGEKSENEGEKSDDKEEDGELLSRGPIRGSRAPVLFHPYAGAYPHAPSNVAAPHSTVNEMSSYNTGSYAGGDYSQPWYQGSEIYASNSSTPDTINSDNGYFSSGSPIYYSQQSSYQQPTPPSYGAPTNAPFPRHLFGDQALTSSDLNRLLAANNDDNTELPDALSDFILKYSRRYTALENSGHCTSSSSRSTESSPQHQPRPSSTDSGCDSPLTAGSAPQKSPAQPRGGISGPCTPTNNQRFVSRTGAYQEGSRLAKEKLRAMFSDEDMDQAWAWTCKCMTYFPGALSYQDPDRDTLLHIVTKLCDLAKIYSLVERMMKLENGPTQKMFDMPNRLYETPLFLAVEKRCIEVVEYLLEAGANPNTQTTRPERETALHYAATRGMTPIVNILCSHPQINVNLSNGMGLTPLLCAVKNHNVLEEEHQLLIDNRPTIQALLSVDADPMIPDATNGRTVIHYALERLDAGLIEIFRKNLPEDKMTALVNMPDLCGETPMNVVESLLNADEQTRQALCLELITCGATAAQSQPTNYPMY